jgi:hypothetical protein
MSDIKLPRVVEYYKTETLEKGRVATSLHLFMIDAEVFDSICLAFIRGENSVVECRYGITYKHPKDKYDKTLAKQEVYKKIKKQRLDIHSIAAGKTDTSIILSCGLTIMKKNDRIIVL